MDISRHFLKCAPSEICSPLQEQQQQEKAAPLHAPHVQHIDMYPIGKPVRLKVLLLRLICLSLNELMYGNKRRLINFNYI